MHAAPTRQIPFTASFAGHFQLTAPGYREQQTKLMAIHKCNYGNWEGNHVLAVLHTRSHEDRGKKNDKAGVESNRREPRNERDWISPQREPKGIGPISVYILTLNRERVGESAETGQILTEGEIDAARGIDGKIYMGNQRAPRRW